MVIFNPDCCFQRLRQVFQDLTGSVLSHWHPTSSKPYTLLLGDNSSHEVICQYPAR